MSENKAFDQVYDQIYSMLCYSPDGKSISDTNTMIQLGINKPIAPTDYEKMFSPDHPDGDVQAACKFAALVDQIPNIGSTASSSGKSLSTVYRDIVKSANAQTKSTDEQKKRYEDAKKVLFSQNVQVKNPDYDPTDPESSQEVTVVKFTPLYQAYLSNKAKYDTAVIKYMSEFSSIDTKSIGGQAQLRKLQNRIDNAYKDWQAAGRVEVEKALATMATSMNDGLSTVIAEAQELVEKSFLVDNTGAKWGVSYPIPALKNYISIAEKATSEVEAYLKIKRVETEALENEIAQNQLELQKTKKEKDIEKLETQIGKLKDKLEALKDKINGEIEKINSKYADKIDAEVTVYNSFEFSKNSYKEKKHSDSSTYGAGVAFSYGLFSLGGTGSGTTSHSSLDTETSDVIVKGQIATIQIIRPWFNPNIFAIKGWTTTMAGKHKISSGNINDKEAMLPMYTTSLILAKDLSIESKFEKTKIDEKSFSMNVDARIGFGPFKFGPKYSKQSSDFSCEKTATGFKLTNKGVQIIGYVNTIVPACPYADDPAFKK